MLLRNIPQPYGLAILHDFIYWTDFKTKALHRANKITGNDSAMLRNNVEGFMDLHAVQSGDLIAKNRCHFYNAGCSHLCLRNPFRHTCACPTGIIMQEDTKGLCKPQSSTYLLVAAGYGLKRLSFDSLPVWDVTLPIEYASRINNVDFHYDKELIFFTDQAQKAIVAVSTYDGYGNFTVLIHDNVDSPNGIAVDWVADNIYWTSKTKNTIEVSRLDGSHRKVLIRGIQQPRSIAVFPGKGYLYWVDYKARKIERSLLDGSNRITIADRDITFPLSLTIDYKGKRVYWCDNGMDSPSISHTNLDGGNRIQIPVKTSFPFSITQVSKL